MTSLPAVQDLQTYLAYAGWQCHEETWHGALIWSNEEGREVLVPANNDLADTDLRISEVLSVLTSAEARPAAEIVTDINTPFDDIQWYRILAGDGFMSLSAGVQTLQSVRDLIGAAARTVVGGMLPVIPRGAPPDDVGKLLQQIRLGPNNPADHVVTVRIPLAAPSWSSGDELTGDDTNLGAPLGRQVGHRLRTAVIAAHQAATDTAGRGDPAAFDASVAAGVSANLCDALIGLAGRGLDQPFEITFRWGRGLPTDAPADSVRFPTGTATAMRAGAKRLRRLGSGPVPPGSSLADPGTATMVGLVDSLHGESPNGGWLVTLRGDLAANSGIQRARTARVLLSSLGTYDRAMAAHRSRTRVRARGELSGSGKRIELNVNDDNFDIPEGMHDSGI
jgi:hypothetical protein